MKSNPNQTWRQGMPLAAWWVSLATGIVFGILGKNLFDPDHFWWKYPQNDSFLWISAIAFLVAVVLSYVLWPLAKAMTVREENGNLKVSRLMYLVFFPGVSIMWMFWDVAALSHIEMFSWLGDAAFLVAMVADIVAVVPLTKGFRKRARERKNRIAG